MKTFWAILLALAWLPGVAGAAAPVHEIWVIESAHGPLYDAFTQALRGELSTELPNATVTTRRISDPVPTDGAPDLIITVGVAAASHWLAKPDRAPLLATMIPEVTYRRLLDEVDTPRPASALFIDQPPIRMLGLVRAALPEVRNVAILFGPFSSQSSDRYFSAARKLGLTLYTRTLSSTQDDPLPMLDPILQKSDALLALPDPEVYNGLTIRPLLLATFHEKKPVFGYSGALVQAGATAAIYSPPDYLGRDAGKMAVAFFKTGGKLPDPSYPRHFLLDTNNEVAYSLRLSLPVPQQLQERLEELLKP